MGSYLQFDILYAARERKMAKWTTPHLQRTQWSFGAFFKNGLWVIKVAITWLFYVFFQHLGYQIKADISAHADKVINISSSDWIRLTTCFHWWGKTFESSLLQMQWVKKAFTQRKSEACFRKAHFSERHTMPIWNMYQDDRCFKTKLYTFICTTAKRSYGPTPSIHPPILSCTK